jgi:hypothetical protein
MFSTTSSSVRSRTTRNISYLNPEYGARVMGRPSTRQRRSRAGARRPPTRWRWGTRSALILHPVKVSGDHYQVLLSARNDANRAMKYEISSSSPSLLVSISLPLSPSRCTACEARLLRLQERHGSDVILLLIGDSKNVTIVADPPSLQESTEVEGLNVKYPENIYDGVTSSFL